MRWFICSDAYDLRRFWRVLTANGLWLCAAVLVYCGMYGDDLMETKWWKRTDFDKIVSRGTLIIENEKSVFYNFGGFLVILL